MLRLSGCNRTRAPMSCTLHLRCLSNLNRVPTEFENIIEPKTSTPPENVREEKKTPSSQSPKHFKSSFKVYDENSPRFNDFNIQMIPKSMSDHLFGKDTKSVNRNMQELNKAIEELKKHGLMSGVEGKPDVKFSLPKLEGKTIDDHFFNIGEEQSAPYRKLVLNFLTELPKMPTHWELKEGWTKYTEEGAFSVSYPDEDSLVFDVEVCCSEGQMPTLATAVGSRAWYAWVSPALVDGGKRTEKERYTVDRLIPLESTDEDKGYNLPERMKRPRIVIGHNVSYDRARVKEQYWVEKTGLRFLDTLSLHVSVSGVTSYQRNLLKAGLGQEDQWSKLSSLNNLSKVHQLYCGSELSKEERDIFVKGTLADVSDNFQTLMSYCAGDVVATHEVLCKVFPMYLDRFPHPVSLAGLLELGLAYLPVNSNWNQYIADCNEVYNDLDHEAKQILSQLADNACQLLHDDAYKKNLWLWDQDWSVKNLTLKKSAVKNEKNIKPDDSCVKDKADKDCSATNDDPDFDELSKKFQKLLETRHSLPLKPPHLPGYPAWYTKLCPRVSSAEWSGGPQLSTAMQIAPKLLALTWLGVPLHFLRGHGWGMLVPYATDIPVDNIDPVTVAQLVLHCQNSQSELFCGCKRTGKEGIFEFDCDKGNLKSDVSKNGSPVFCRSEMGSGCGLIKLPHKDGKHLNVGNPLARDYIHKFSKDGLGGGDEKTERLIEISRMLSYWRNNKERVENQIAVWLFKKDIPTFMKSDGELGAILPQVIVAGTLTRRAVEPTWMTASNALSDRIGSELRAMIMAPPSHCLVGADVDSQELWIASVLGDARLGHGSTPLGWMTLSGHKADGTDMHSVTARAVGISRNHAKVINYARIYGAGQPFAEHLLKQFNPDMSASEAKQKASKMFAMTKGKRVYVLKKSVLPDIRRRVYTKYGAREVCSLHGKSIEELFEVPKWVGGTESAMFNRLEEIASDPQPKTPFLKGRLSRALEPGADADDKFVPTRVNWVVQSGAVDFLHLMLVCMRWLLGPDVRFCLSFHDEVRYLVPKSQRYRAALALHVTNLYTRAFCVSRLGLVDLPRSVAFFSSVEVDTVLRKEADLDCRTPSNPFGLEKGYGVAPGESLSIEEAIKKARGIVGLPSFRNKRYLTF